MVLEQLGNGLITETARRCFYNDFLQMEEIVRKKGDEYDVDSAEPFLLLSQSSPGAAAEAPRLYQQQLGLSSILESSASYEEAMHLLAQSSPGKLRLEDRAMGAVYD